MRTITLFRLSFANMSQRVPFKDLWSIFQDSSWNFHGPYVNACFKNHTEWTEHKIMVFKPATKYQINWQCHNFKNTLLDDFQHHPFVCRAKVLEKNFYGGENNKLQRRDNHSNICLLLDLIWCQKNILKNFIPQGNLIFLVA